MHSDRTHKRRLRRAIAAIVLAFVVSLTIATILMQRTAVNSAAIMATYAELEPAWVFSTPDAWPSGPGQSGRTAITGLSFTSQRKWSGLNAGDLFDIPDMASYTGQVRVFFQYRLDAGWPFRAHGLGKLEVADSALRNGASRAGHTTIWEDDRGHLIAIDEAPWTPASPRIATAVPGLIRPTALLGNVVVFTPVLFGLLSVPSLFARRTRRNRMGAGKCPACGYESGCIECPECGNGKP